MASSISSTGLGGSLPLQSVGVEARRGRSEPAAEPRAVGDIQSVSETWRSAREASRQAVFGLDLAAATAREAARLLGEIESIAGRAAKAPDDLRGAEAGALRSAGQQYERLLAAGLEGGAFVLSGAPLQVDLGGGDILTVNGADLRGSAPPAAALSDANGAKAVALAAAAAAGTALEAAGRWEEASSRLTAHSEVLAAAVSGAKGGEASLSEDAARLAALQVRQTLSEGRQDGLAVANADPAAILALFKQ